MQVPGLADQAARLMTLLDQVRACNLCAGYLPHAPKPVLRANSSARILVIGQTPGTRVHATGIPWNDPSGRRLRQWMGIDDAQFYDETLVAIVPMGFCYPGRGRSGDLPHPSPHNQLWLRSNPWFDEEVVPALQQTIPQLTPLRAACPPSPG